MKNNNMSDMIASGMDAILKDPEYKSMFSSSAVLEKLAFKRVADEDQPTEIEVELSTELMTEPLEVTAKEEARADCLVCGKKRAGWTEGDGICKCAKSGCSPLKGGCKEGCSCDCKTKKAGVEMDDMLIKSAFDSLMSASSDLEEAGFEQLSANALILMNHLIVEAKKAKNKKGDDKEAKAKEKAKMLAAKEKEKAAKEKEKAKAEKDKNMAKDKKMKDHAAKMKAKERMEAEKEKAKAKAEKEKAKKGK